MTSKYIEQRIEEIKQLASQDYEVAHSLEDNLYEEVLMAIKYGHPRPKALAAAVLKTKAIAFQRVCA